MVFGGGSALIFCCQCACSSTIPPISRVGNVGKVRLSKRFIFFNLSYALRVELVAGKRELVGMTVFFAGVLIFVE